MTLLSVLVTNTAEYLCFMALSYTARRDKRTVVMAHVLSQNAY